MVTNKNHHLYKDTHSETWYFQKKVRGIEKPYKFSLETISIVEARRKRDEYLKQIAIYGYIPKAEQPIVSESPLFGEIAQQWAAIKKTKVSMTTFSEYQKSMNKYVLPVFGNKQIDRMTSLEIEAFMSKLPGSGKYKQNIMTPFKNIMKFAKKHKIIQYNPMEDVEGVKTSKMEIHPLSLEEIGTFLDHVEDFYYPLFVTLFFAGLRIGELAGLKWKRVDLPKRVLKIRKTIVFRKGIMLYKEPKTQSSIRDVKITEVVVEALRIQRQRTWKGEGDNFVFLNKWGRPINAHSLNYHVFKRTLLKAGLPMNRSLKDTRSSFITNALDANERLGFIQKQVGHTNTKMIVNHYYNHIPSKDDGARLEDAWNSTRILPESKEVKFQHTEITK
jgi:integrase